MSLKLGLVGAGAAAELHANALKNVEGVSLSAVFNRSSEEAKEFAANWEINCFDDYEELLAMNELDIIDICTATGTHSQFAVPAAKAGKNLIIEKPLEITPEKCDEIIAAAGQNNVKVAVIFQNRFKDSIRTIRTALRKGRLGRLVLGTANVNWYRSPEYYRNNWKGTKDLDGGGALINQSIHTIDLLQWLMGDADSITGRVKTLTHEIEGEDIGVATLEFSNGSLGTITGSTAIYPGLDEELGIYGTKGSIELTGSRITTWEMSETKPGDEEIIAVPEEEGKSGASNPTDIESENHRRQIQEIVDALRSDKTPPVPGNEAKKSVRIINAIYESSRTGKTIELN
ncbi:Gfo/Idh/MocA family oxidoreductase [Candidatus Bipolaricaulota bacterium]|nr:Gfo/Idh/MocA family oxidoreductase [Candidatus Bipolaricaulota bacterium]